MLGRPKQSGVERMRGPVPAPVAATIDAVEVDVESIPRRCDHARQGVTLLGLARAVMSVAMFVVVGTQQAPLILMVAIPNALQSVGAFAIAYDDASSARLVGAVSVVDALCALAPLVLVSVMVAGGVSGNGTLGLVLEDATLVAIYALLIVDLLTAAVSTYRACVDVAPRKILHLLGVGSVTSYALRIVALILYLVIQEMDASSIDDGIVVTMGVSFVIGVIGSVFLLRAP